MGAIPTITVKNKKGHVMTINAIDFDPKEHRPLAAGEQPQVEKPKEVPPLVEGAIANARTKAALKAIAAQHGLELGDAEKMSMAKIRAELLPQIKAGG